MKFGGSSIASADKVRDCVRLVRHSIDIGANPVIVVSAHGKTTNNLIAAAENARDGTPSTRSIREIHLGLVNDLGLEVSLIDGLMDELEALLRGVSLIQELTPRTLDRIMSFGERLSTRIISAELTRSGILSTPVNAFEIGLLTDDKHGSASPLPNTYDLIAEGLSSVSGVPVVTGFLGRGPTGDITTLGRSGSDFTASILGAALDAEEVQIWTDVSGVMTCDPSVDSGAMSLPQLSFDEASELAYYGAEVLHPSTLVPAIGKGVPVRVLNTARPQDPGTVILQDTVRTDRIAKSIVYKEDVDLVTIASHRLLSAVQILSKAFEILADHGIGVHMATTSEATVSLVTDRDYPEDRMAGALSGLEALGTAGVERGKAIICVIGEELRHKADVLSRIFGSLSREDIKAKMVSQSASEINVAFLVDNSEIEKSVRALHRLIVPE